jgi:hypothetical protein
MVLDNRPDQRIAPALLDNTRLCAHIKKLEFSKFCGEGSGGKECATFIQGAQKKIRYLGSYMTALMGTPEDAQECHLIALFPYLDVIMEA